MRHPPGIRGNLPVLPTQAAAACSPRWAGRKCAGLGTAGGAGITHTPAASAEKGLVEPERQRHCPRTALGRSHLGAWGTEGHGSATRDGLAQLSALPLVPSLASGKTWGELPGLGHAKVQHILPDGSWEGQRGPKDRHPPRLDLRTRMTQIIWLLLPTPWNHCSLAPVCSSDAPNLSPPQGLCTGYSPSWHTHTRTPHCLGRLLPVI